MDEELRTSWNATSVECTREHRGSDTARFTTNIPEQSLSSE
ncbi:hypothetical protein GCK32_021007 [Trichostrongylus colubriformis]|uniref:Uncharacterized protein n=1 Tax=Trichostrongylus colubriformis TaxID=6319 RepID=A0AAN8FHX2_TRICO